MKLDYTEEERTRIGGVLLAAGGEFDTEVIDLIELFVGLAGGAVENIKKHPVDGWLFEKYLDLPKNIKVILSVLEDKQSRHLDEFIPNLRHELQFFLRMIESDKKTGPGRRPNPETKHWSWLVLELAELWHNKTGKMPSRHYREDFGSESGEFPHFVRVCLEPAGLTVPERALREAIEEFRLRTQMPQKP
ncbi:MAG: hypothetical protein H6907_17720 [Hyphomicrobiales bacterium]|nr:hypothetical protein [Hyphomicrobiales bacterium]MCP5373571.1 hypothetical protein [Hyphomicrobiales bacterium]